MGCLGVALAALLALAVPASIARSSLVGAYVVIAVLSVAAIGAVVARGRNRRAGPLPVPPAGSVRTGPAVAWIALSAVSYAGLVTVIHLAG